MKAYALQTLQTKGGGMPCNPMNPSSYVVGKEMLLTCRTQSNESLGMSFYEHFVALRVPLVHESPNQRVHKVVGCDCGQIPLQSAQDKELPTLREHMTQEKRETYNDMNRKF